MTYSLLPWTMEQDESPDECWYVIQDAEGHVVCFATKDDAEVIIRAVNNHAQLAEALENITKLCEKALAQSGRYYPQAFPEYNDAIAALDAAKEGEK